MTMMMNSDFFTEILDGVIVDISMSTVYSNMKYDKNTQEQKRLTGSVFIDIQIQSSNKNKKNYFTFKKK